MRLFFGALVLNFILFFNEIEASGFTKKICTERNSSEKGRDRNDIIDTPRPITKKAFTHNPPSVEHQVLNLHGYHSHSQEPSHQQISTEALDLVNNVKSRNGLPPQVASSSRMIQNDRIQYQSPESSQAYSGRENINWLLEHYRHGTLPLPQLGVHASRPHPKDENMNELVHDPSMRIRRNQYTEEEILGKKLSLKEKMVLDAKMLEAKRVFALPLKEHGKLIQLGPFQDNRKQDFRTLLKEKDALNLFDMYYPDGLPSPKPQPDTSPEKPPPALHEIDESITPGGYRRQKQRTHQKRATWKAVPDHRDKLSKQSQLPEHAYQHHQPE